VSPPFKTIENYLPTGLPDGIFSNQKNPIWVNFGGLGNGKCWNVLHTRGIYYGHLVYFIGHLVIWQGCQIFLGT
jgi:hypothetical protein